MAHEKAHSTTEYDDIIYTDDNQINYNTARAGQLLMKAGEGTFLEEGFAEYMAARFIRNELKCPNGIWGNERYKDLGDGLTLPSIYVWPGSTQPEDADSPRSYVHLSNSHGAYGAYGIDLIAQKYPEIHTALINARKSVEGLRQVAQIIERVRPGLYSEIRKLRKFPEDFKKGLQSIQLALAT